MENKNSTYIHRILKRIRETRKIKGLSNENMAFELDISPSAYNKLERSETMLTLDRLLLIKDILDISLTDLLEIKTGDILHQDLKDNSIGKVETLHQENKEVYEKLIASKDDQIALLKSLLDKKH